MSGIQFASCVESPKERCGQCTGARYSCRGCKSGEIFPTHLRHFLFLLAVVLLIIDTFFYNSALFPKCSVDNNSFSKKYVQWSVGRKKVV